MYVQDYLEQIKTIKTTDELLLLAKKLSEGDIQYAYPYHMKEFVIKYSKLIVDLLTVPVIDQTKPNDV